MIILAWLLGTVCLVVSGTLFWVYTQEPQSIDIVTNNTVEAVASSSAISEITVDISGAIVKPGIYQLSMGSRVFEVVEKANGFRKDAHKEWVQKNLNLAAKLTDAQKIYIPFDGEIVDVEPISQIVSGNTDLKKDINNVDQAELESIRGIGPETAKKIIEFRTLKGSIGDLNELLEIPGIGEKTVTALHEFFEP